MLRALTAMWWAVGPNQLTFNLWGSLHHSSQRLQGPREVILSHSSGTSPGRPDDTVPALAEPPRTLFVAVTLPPTPLNRTLAKSHYKGPCPSLCSPFLASLCWKGAGEMSLGSQLREGVSPGVGFCALLGVS